jgi:NADH:ubiquinone oxidoreductase subunit
MKRFISELFIWWHSQTMGTRLWTWRHGERVGSDEFGNVYYRTKGGRRDKTLGFERRWVIYDGYAEASKVPPGWYGWLHHTFDTPPRKDDAQPRAWQKPHEPNHTGTVAAYRPPGSAVNGGRRPQVSADYEAWTPGG